MNLVLQNINQHHASFVCDYMVTQNIDHGH